MNEINIIYDKLIEEYSPQGWWPLTSFNGANPTKTGALKGYHPGNYSFPKNSFEQFEIIIGAILTQNTSWVSVEKSLLNLKKLIDFTPYELLNLAKNDEDSFKHAIKPSGYYNQKFNYLINVSEFFISLNNKTPLRSEILEVKGVGPETADSILLYAYREKEFVVDAYTKRMFSYLKIINETDSYLKIKELFEENFKGGFKEYQEYHALIVEHGKRYYSKKPYGVMDKVLKR